MLLPLAVYESGSAVETASLSAAVEEDSGRYRTGLVIVEPATIVIEHPSCLRRAIADCERRQADAAGQ